MTDSAASCAQCALNEFDIFFHHFGTQLEDAKSVELFKTEITALILRIWLASYAQRITPCIVGAVRDCVDYARKRTNFPVDPLIQLYDFKFEDKSLPAWIILHSLSDDPSRVGSRHQLLQLFLDELPLTTAIRDDMYLACGATGYNNFFNRIRTASLRELQTTIHTRLMELGRNLRQPSGFVETTMVTSTSSGFKLKWFVPDMAQRLRSGLAIGTEFVVKGRVWGLYIQSYDGDIERWKVILCVVKPFYLNHEASDISILLDISRFDKRKAFKYGSRLVRLYTSFVETLDLPVQGEMPKTQHALGFRINMVKDARSRCITRDGGCYLTLTLTHKPLSGWKGAIRI